MEIDEELLQQAQRALDTKTFRETVEAAFLEVLRHEARRDEVEALAKMKGLELDDPEVMAGAWRP